MTKIQRLWFVLYRCPACAWEIGGVARLGPLPRTVAYPCCWKGPGHTPEVLEAVLVAVVTRREADALPTLVLPALAAGDTVAAVLKANHEVFPLDEAPFLRDDEKVTGGGWALIEFAPWPNRGNISSPRRAGHTEETTPSESLGASESEERT